jgi:CRP-like cAMP-binding protein
MKKTENRKRKDQYLKQQKILTLFSDPDRIEFEMYEFSKGEIINNIMDPIDWLLFTVSGIIRIYNVRDSGSLALLAEGEEFTVLGDVEFASHEISAYIVEAASKVTCLGIDLKKYRHVLEKDPVFLNFLLGSVTEKLRLVTAWLLEPDDLRERTIYYMEHTDQRTLKGVNAASMYLQCSKRQLLRILKSLQDEGIIEKTGRGTYRMKM